MFKLFQYSSLHWGRGRFSVPATIKLSKKSNELTLKDKDLFFKLVQDSFKMKRKNIKNNLKGYDLDKIAKVLDSYGLDLTARAESINLKCFVDMANILSK